MHFPMNTLARMQVIRPWRRSDLDAIVRNADNYAVWRNLRDRFPHPYTPRHAKDWLASVRDEDPVLNFAITVNDEAAGGIGIAPGKDVERFSAEVGYWLGERFWGRGLATEALREITTYAFTVVKLHRLYAAPFAFNRASVRVLEKAGYRKEGTLRESAIKEGTVTDQELYAITAPEWRLDP